MSKYGSRKFLTTNYGMTLGFVALPLGVLMQAPEGYWTALAGLFVLLGLGVGAYNYANVRWNKDATTTQNDR